VTVCHLTLKQEKELLHTSEMRGVLGLMMVNDVSEVGIKSNSSALQSKCRHHVVFLFLSHVTLKTVYSLLLDQIVVFLLCYSSAVSVRGRKGFIWNVRVHRWITTVLRFRGATQ
jgi:hypothetical protein